MEWFDYVFITCLAFGFGFGLDQHLIKIKKNQEKVIEQNEKIIEQNEKIIELLKNDSYGKEIQFV